ncbi:hypothetical protein RCL_jg21883.t1 [Rhizophagus clarus]|uniref:Protein kinase domain-containing protein n=1 Tax=Rhizophagus clarus TaxID=94130 RepID=A0A8H3MGA2_9GLOM|nr:hypothetical protein RCL_jg21883.t1 [Rhizophagus clarus]
MNCGYYLLFCKDQVKDGSPTTNMPCFLITIAGPTFAVYGAIFSDIAVVDPLTTTFHLYWLKNNNEMMTALSSTFRALKLSLKELDKYYENMIQIFPRQHLSFPDVKVNGATYRVQVNSQYDSGHAPIIIYNTEIPGGWLLIYMECLDQHLMLDRITRNLNDGERFALSAEIRRVINNLHNSNFVHGDLREGNILVWKNNVALI